MKKRFKVILFVVAFGAFNAAIAQTDTTGFAVDNFDLYGALDLFKESENTEAFEKSINDKETGINNLDLNADGKVDYVKVVDRSVGDNKVLILQDIISEKESQDVAVILMEKKGDEVVSLQIVGDEAMYGKEYVIEPKEEQIKQQAADAVSKPREKTNVYVNVWGWPGVRWMYRPTYVVWDSPYRWAYYPTWWLPWPPYAWHVYHPRVKRFHHTYYHRVHIYRLPHAHKVYYGHRTTSTVVVNRNRTGLVHKDGNLDKPLPHTSKHQAEAKRQKQIKNQQRDATKHQHKTTKRTDKIQRKNTKEPRR